MSAGVVRWVRGPGGIATVVVVLAVAAYVGVHGIVAQRADNCAPTQITCLPLPVGLGSPTMSYHPSAIPTGDPTTAHPTPMPSRPRLDQLLPTDLSVDLNCR